MTQTKVRVAIAGACLLALTATACGSDDNTATDNTSAAPVASAVTDAGGTAASAGAAGLTIAGRTFSPATVTAGTDFTVTNNDSAPHTVTADDGSFDTDVGANATATMKIDTAGTFAIHCKIHPSMHGTITVA